ncbi:hypothetical protein EXIGLDRAFT_766999 [Exidia glandulosa HHB12029]|uniref:Cryptic loci regulator 2 N-terminal domain-containing protein n=1 Tax=Exidia glandulosa HHB12029 TaxID=1314781 RepID=A0A165JAW5_EXIGL|nr:hypothetical protein EXIGLDRAFT_766999 [Exidia glandulosa HHB12029]
MGRDIGASFQTPKDVVTIAFPRSDGTASRRPDQPPTPTDGSVNFFRPVSSREPAHARWRHEVAMRMALHVPSLDKSKKYILAAFPDDYELFDHTKGSRDNPRHDLYLWGSKTVTKFRSVNEFVPHAIWLYNHNTAANCGCRYCSNAKGQGEISQQYGLPSHLRLEAAPVTIRRIVRPALAPAPEQRAASQRDADLRGAVAATRRYRIGEVAWCQIEPPLASPDPNVFIRWWPAIVREVRLKSTATGRKSVPGSAAEYVVRQSHVYKMQLLGVLYHYTVPEEMMLPYLAYAPDPDLLATLREGKAPVPLSEDLRELAYFFPMPTPKPTHFPDLEENSTLRQGSWEDALAPYGLALQVAAYITTFWCFTDEWEFKAKASKSSALPAPSASTSAAGESEVIPSPRRPQSEWRYQGAWWGNERIWMDDLVRLHPYRDQIPLDELLPESEGADTRTLFMLVTGMFITHTNDRHKGKIAGLLYELAPEGWKDPTPSKSPSKNVVIEKDFAVADQPLSSPLRRAVPTIPGQPPLQYGLPAPPRGFVFRLITPPGFEVILDIAMVAGRYYSDLLESPAGHLRLQELHFDKLGIPGAEELVNQADLEPVLSLGGLAASFGSKMGCQEWKRTRQAMLTSADTLSREALYTLFTNSDVKTEDPMLID